MNEHEDDYEYEKADDLAAPRGLKNALVIIFVMAAAMFGGWILAKIIVGG